MGILIDASTLFEVRALRLTLWRKACEWARIDPTAHKPGQVAFSADNPFNARYLIAVERERTLRVQLLPIEELEEEEV
jgi:hypothetical protein